MRKSYLMLAALTAIIGIMMIIAPTECIKVCVIAVGIAIILNGLHILITVRNILPNSNFCTTETIKGFASIIIGALAVLLPLVFAGLLWTIMIYVIAVFLLISAATEVYLIMQLKAANIETHSFSTEAIVSVALAAILFCLPIKIGIIILRLGGIALLVGSAICIYLEWKHKPLTIKAEILKDADLEK
ncbi:MAG: hypothetical protein GX297_00005 [Treponema sp.]|nr:hypothetical protein [Treponema sp.]